MVKVPDDIKKYVHRNILKRVNPCIVLVVVSLVLVYLAYDYLESFGYLNPICALILCLLFSFIVTGVPIRLIDKSYTGTIVDIRVKKIKWMDKGFKCTGGIKTLVLLDIRDNKNNIITHEVNNSKLDEHGYDEIYSIGDKVFHVYGTDYLGVVPFKKDYSVCVVCGANNRHIKGKCDICKFSLINIEKM